MDGESHRGDPVANGSQKSWLPWGLACVVGDSMQPTLQPGDLLVVDYRTRVHPGRVVVARFVDGTVTVKRATEPRTGRSGEPGWWLLGDHVERSVDSRHRGPVPESDVLAHVVGRLWPRPRRL